MKKLKSIGTHLATKSFLGLKAVVLSYNLQHKEKIKGLSCLVCPHNYSKCTYS